MSEEQPFQGPPIRITIKMFSNALKKMKKGKAAGPSGLNFLLIGIHSMHGWTVTTRHGVTRKRSTNRLKHPGNLFRKNLQLNGVC